MKPAVPSPATIVVVGSVNMDLVARVPRIPAPGETLTGYSFQTLPGGKGANQAVAVSRLGGRSLLVGRVGGDDLGRALRRNLAEQGVDLAALRAVPDVASGTALIQVAEAPAGAQNSIAVIPGANHRLTPADIRRHASLIARADAVLVQLEIPLETAAAALQIAADHDVFSVLDTAPAPPGGLPPELFADLDILSPNQSEASALSGQPCRDRAEAETVAALLFRRYQPGLVVIKLGADGALAYAGPDLPPFHQPAFPVAPKDTTAAGDAFTAALTLRLAEGADLAESLRFAASAGAIAVTRDGAQDAMPDRAEVLRLLRRPSAARRPSRRRT